MPSFSNSCCCGLSVTLMLAFAGCAHKPGYESPELPLRGIMAPRHPEFIVGPAALVLTNSAAFSARIEWRSTAAGPGSTPVAGQLLGRGSRLLFAPETEPPADKRIPAAGFSWLWDAAEQRGWLLSETLQGYSPLSSRAPVTGVTAAPATPVARRPEGHPCEQQRYEFKIGNVTKVLQVLRATDLNGFPLEILTDEPGAGYVITLSRVRFEQPPAALFAPPDSFTAYASPEAMVDELAMRQRKLRGLSTHLF